MVLLGPAGPAAVDSDGRISGRRRAPLARLCAYVFRAVCEKMSQVVGVATTAKATKTKRERESSVTNDDGDGDGGE